MMVRDFQSVIGEECRVQMPKMIGRQPDYVVACVGGGSNAAGIFYPYLDHADVKLIGVEAGGRGPRQRPPRGIAHRRLAGRAARQPHLPAAGRGRPDHRDAFGVGRPRLSGRRPGARLAEGFGPRAVRVVDDEEALAAFHDCCRIEGIIPALESSHALAYAAQLAATLPDNQTILVNLSGRGDKDMHTVAQRAGREL